MLVHWQSHQEYLNFLHETKVHLDSSQRTRLQKPDSDYPLPYPYGNAGLHQPYLIYFQCISLSAMFLRTFQSQIF